MTKQDNSKPQASVAPPDIAAPSQALGAASATGPAAPTTDEAIETLPEPAPRDGLIVLSIVIVSAAIAMMCFTQIGLSLSVSAATGVVVLALSMLLHKQVQKTAQIAQLKAELAQTRHDVKPNGIKANEAKAGAPSAKSAPLRAPTAAVPAPAVAPVSSTPEARIRELSRDIGNLVPRSEAAASAQPAGAPQPKSVAPEQTAIRAPASGDAMSDRGGDKQGRSAPRPVMQPTLQQPFMQTAAQPSLEVPAKAPLKPAPEAKGRPVFSAPAADRPAPPEAGRERWSFRRRVDAQPQPVKGPAPAPGWPAADATPAANPAVTIEGDLELVQRKIKELADEVNAAEALRAPKPARPNDRAKTPSSALEESIGALRAVANNMRQRPSLGDFVPTLDTAAPKPAAEPAPPPMMPAAAAAATSAPAQALPAQAFVPPVAAEPSPSQGLGELVIPATAERIAGFEADEDTNAGSGFDQPGFDGRTGEQAGEPEEQQLPLPELALPELPILEFAADAAPNPELPPRVAAVARAIEDELLDVMLGPIVTLAEHSVGHYEMTTILRSSTGDALEANEEDFALIGELDSRFDIARLNRAAALAGRMDARDRGGLLLTSFLGSSVTSRAFLESFAHTYEARPRIAEQLVLTFSQRTLDGFTPAAWQALRDMHSFGFRFALDSVTHMGTDFAALQQTGFRFVRLGAQALLDGMTSRDRFVPAEEILQRATLAGLSIVANGIADAATQKRLLDTGVLLGQGTLFGAPRQVNVGGGAPAKHSAAA
ncbi:MAG: EAL domain-containing protein [Proteobacteria bacterium]|nr:EAL domain-containing protein [Pseudomonadota bacterium]